MHSNLTTGIVIVNFNTTILTCNCIDSIANSSDKAIVIIIINNASTDNPKQAIVEQCKSSGINFVNVTTIEEPLSEPNKRPPITLYYFDSICNLGFAGANNIGFRIATRLKCHYIWMLNSDTTILANTHTIYKQATKTTPNCLLGATLIYPNSQRIQACGGALFSFFSFRGREYRPFQTIDDLEFSKSSPQLVDYIIGASCFFQTETLAKIGPMPEDYFLYYEDLDWCMTARDKGVQSLWIPQAVVFHHEGASIGSNNKKTSRSKLSVYLGQLNRIRFASKFGPAATIRATFTSTILACYLCANLQFRLGGLAFLGIFDFFCSKRRMPAK